GHHAQLHQILHSPVLVNQPHSAGVSNYKSHHASAFGSHACNSQSCNAFMGLVVWQQLEGCQFDTRAIVY
ncbi:unnamed protein product, partial [Staurois parvus]